MPRINPEYYSSLPEEVVSFVRNSGFNLFHVRSWRTRYPENQALAQLRQDFKNEAWNKERNNLTDRLKAGGEFHGRRFSEFSPRALQRMRDKLQKLENLTT